MRTPKWAHGYKKARTMNSSLKVSKASEVSETMHVAAQSSPVSLESRYWCFSFPLGPAAGYNYPLGPCGRPKRVSRWQQTLHSKAIRFAHKPEALRVGRTAYSSRDGNARSRFAGGCAVC